ncbi:glycoside hydrolase [Trametes gibbosa]|nr:glycoside hydrolase [Trametes gibbosa]
MGYYPDWAETAFPPEKIDFGRLDWIDFAFAVPDAAFDLSWDGSDDAPRLLTRLVSHAHAAGKKAKLSVGGWTGSRYFSGAAATAAGRAALVANIHALYTQFGLDGIDVDWEYPAQDGAPGNQASPDDGAHFLAFLRALRAALPVGATITAATQTVPFAGPDGAPMRDVSAFAEVLDWVLLMNYDTWGSSSTPGPNAPLGDACHNSTQAGASALAALRTWTAAGFPASQLVLGVPSYGYLSRSSAAALRTRAAPPRPRVLDWVGALVDTTGAVLPPPPLPGGAARVHNEDGGADDGQVQFRDLVAQGVLLPYLGAARPPPNGTTGAASAEPPPPPRLFAGGAGFERGWDGCSSTPFLRSAAAGQVVTYDDPASLEMKAELVRAAGMRGVNLFDVSGDTDQWDLVDALRRGLGLV